VAEDPDIADAVISYAKLTAFGVEVFRECVGLSGGGKRKPRRRRLRLQHPPPQPSRR
jgi:hypothetical protein